MTTPINKKALECELIEETKQHYNCKRVRVYDEDPRNEAGLLDDWESGDYIWFPYKHYQVGEDIATIWCECGYGHYAIMFKGKVHGMAKDCITTKDFILVGECQSQGGELVFGITLQPI